MRKMLSKIGAMLFPSLPKSTFQDYASAYDSSRFSGHQSTSLNVHHLPSGLYLVMSGYYFDLDKMELLSLKSGTLKPLKRQVLWLGGKANHKALGWRVSHNGYKRILLQDTIVKQCHSGFLKQSSEIVAP